MARRKSFLKRAPQSEEMSLQITSMADIFTILLVFLLKSYATGAIEITPSKNTILPQAQASEKSVEALKVEISENSINIEGQPVAVIDKFNFNSADISGNGSDKPLALAFERERKRQMLIAQNNSDVKLDPRIIVIADQHAPYSTIKTVLASAAVNGYTDFKLAVMDGN